MKNGFGAEVRISYVCHYNVDTDTAQILRARTARVNTLPNQANVADMFAVRESGATMDFKPGDRVSVKGFVMPLVVESIDGDDVTVLEYDIKKKKHVKKVYKAATLHPTPKRKGPIRLRF